MRWVILATVLCLVAQPALAETPSSPLQEEGGNFPTSRRAAPLSRNELLALHPKDLFKECDVCPEVVVGPAGEFIMGAPEAEAGSTPDERPQHKVMIARPFSVGRFPVTFKEWDACVEAMGCRYQPSDQIWDPENRPVVG